MRADSVRADADISRFIQTANGGGVRGRESARTKGGAARDTMPLNENVSREKDIKPLRGVGGGWAHAVAASWKKIPFRLCLEITGMTYVVDHT